jgi:hypothetical protein
MKRETLEAKQLIKEQSVKSEISSQLENPAQPLEHSESKVNFSVSFA